MTCTRTASAIGLSVLIAVSTASRVDAGAFVVSGEANGLDVISHPVGYNGTGGALIVSVCIDPTSANAADMVIPTQNIINTMNDLAPTAPNIVSGTIPGQIDWESVALHELGHCGFALAHVNAASESGLTGNNQNYTKATDGANNSFDIDDGVDAIIGSADDVRSDDVNLHWFRLGTNDPCDATLPATIDASTYARAAASLPLGDLFAANADFAVCNDLGFANTEAVMQQGTFINEEQRDLTGDDVATARLGMAGLDETQGNADDYTVTFVYAGLTTSCDLVIDFDNGETGFAVCSANLTNFSGDHWSITSGDMFYNTGSNWFFNPVPNGPTVTPTPTVSPTPTVTPTPNIDHFVMYKAKASTRIDLPINGKFPPRDYNLQLDDAVLPNTDLDDPENYQVKKEKSLLVPAVKNAGTPLIEADLHYVRYQIKEAKEGAGAFDVGTLSYPKAEKHVKRIWSLLNQFGTINVESKKVEALLVPTAKNLIALPPAPGNRTHYICYQVKATKDVTDQTPDAGGKGKFRKDLQAYFGDQFLDVDCALDRDGQPSFPGSPVAGNCLLNLSKVKSLCTPIVKSDVGGAPPRVTVAPPGSNSLPTAVESLLCYQVKLASKVLSTDAAALGNVSIGDSLKQSKHVKRSLGAGTAPHTQPGNQFPAPLQVDTKKTEFACVPSFVTAVIPKP